MRTSTPMLTREVIAAAIEGFEGQKRRIDGRIAELRSVLTGSPTSFELTPGKIRRKFSAVTLKHMREGQQRRWAKPRGQTKPTAKPKRKLSAAGRKAIVDALKRRWAAKKKVS